MEEARRRATPQYSPHSGHSRGNRFLSHLDRTNLPDLEPFVRFDFPTIGHIYDTNGQPLMEMATEYRWISRYEEIPRVISGAILAAEDKNFFSHIRSDPDGVG
jgi:penicillin-binding protein 1A